MYHELALQGRTPCRSELGYIRYVLSADDFHAQMQSVQASGWKGVSISQALTIPAHPAVTITFDDGCETDLLVAAPLLQSVQFNATFYITYGFLGTRGYLTHEQLQQLSDLGFEIGSHSMTHAYLPDLDDSALRREMVESKRSLEQLLGKPVEHFSCPGGRCSRRVEEEARKAGYRSVATSRAHANSKATNPFALGRVAIMRGTRLEAFSALCRGEGLWQMSLRDGARRSAMRVLGNSLYDRVRTKMLRGVGALQ